MFWNLFFIYFIRLNLFICEWLMVFWLVISFKSMILKLYILLVVVSCCFRKYWGFKYLLFIDNCNVKVSRILIFMFFRLIFFGGIF